MGELDYWRLSDHLSVQDAAVLTIGERPSRLFRNGEHTHLPVTGPDFNDRSSDRAFQAVFSAIKNAVLGGTLKAALRISTQEHSFCDTPFDAGDASLGPSSVSGITVNDVGNLSAEGSAYRPRPDWQHTTVATKDLKEWLVSRGVATGFFFPDTDEHQPGYLEKSHPNYAPKLAAAIRAWEAVTSNPELLRGKTPKKALIKWLNENAAACGLTKDDGTPNSTGVEEVAKVANWNLEGGASKTL
ncbi:hypothetical protein V0R50_03390 [Pseudomonas sp. 148P]|uniref:Uncharacterized protein n=1 Tax=Pseudomonas ulcerans TaxID=3115852 RepID=A0ABU7HL52_9PSED|nr:MULTISPECIES: hypothetical protein [unclassified Pseudomonas]MEE1920844.1 hypothetical protein [Pseudomonas sp. 147P]MEE1932255.1 hypothetical protein [Pseudomonas sp. 148P]